MSITVHGISDEDVAILDILWELNTVEELDNYLNSLGDEQLKKTLTLIELTRLAVTDDLIETMDNYPEANYMIKSIMS